MTFALVLGLAQSWRLGSPGTSSKPILYTLPSAFRIANENHFGRRGWQAACFFQVQLLSWGEGMPAATCWVSAAQDSCLSALDLEYPLQAV